MRQGNVGLTSVLQSCLDTDALNKRLKNQGKTTDQITVMLLAEVSKLATHLDATPAWGNVSIRPRDGTYSAYFCSSHALETGGRFPVLMRCDPRSEACVSAFVKVNDT